MLHLATIVNLDVMDRRYSQALNLFQGAENYRSQTSLGVLLNIT